MPALASITINDGQATPVAHTFNPVGPDKNGVQFYHDQSGGIAIGFPSISLDLKVPGQAIPGQSSKASRVYRASFKMILPILEVTTSSATGIEPAPTKAYDLTVKGEFILPERSTLDNRKDILAYARNLLATTVISALVHNLEKVY